jgi:hypothetical protein
MDGLSIIKARVILEIKFLSHRIDVTVLTNNLIRHR